LQYFDELRLRVSLELPTDLEAADVREVDVEQDESGPFCGGDGERVGAVVCFNDSVPPLPAEQSALYVQGGRTIVDNENGRVIGFGGGLSHINLARLIGDLAGIFASPVLNHNQMLLFLPSTFD
jgi:hypothetical protein